MSISASLDICLAKKWDWSFSVADIIKIFIGNGWKIINNNKILYLPLGDNDAFDWQEEQINEDTFFEIVNQKELANEIIGVGLIWKDSDIGGTVLFHSNCEISFNLTINRKKLLNSITDVNWYLERFLPLFETDIIAVEKFTFTQC